MISFLINLSLLFHSFFEAGFFVKMASRSAKDIVLASQKFEDLVVAALEEFCDVPPPEEMLTEEEQERWIYGRLQEGEGVKGKSYITANEVNFSPCTILYLLSTFGYRFVTSLPTKPLISFSKC